jgi:hypothetical protein
MSARVLWRHSRSARSRSALAFRIMSSLGVGPADSIRVAIRGNVQTGRYSSSDSGQPSRSRAHRGFLKLSTNGGPSGKIAAEAIREERLIFIGLWSYVVDESFLKEHLARCRGLANNVIDPCIKSRLLDLAARYEDRLLKTSRATRLINLPLGLPDAQLADRDTG